MSDQSTGRMLLSHNFHLDNNELPTLNRQEFAQVFIDGLQEQAPINCSYLENPHWVVEILFPTDKYSPQEIGEMCGNILTSKRQSQLDSPLTTDTLILGGKKTTPPTNNSPKSLQIGEWGVDVVEIAEAEVFLDSINWHNLTAGKSSDRVFKIELLAN